MKIKNFGKAILVMSAMFLSLEKASAQGIDLQGLSTPLTKYEQGWAKVDFDFKKTVRKKGDAIAFCAANLSHFSVKNERKLNRLTETYYGFGLFKSSGNDYEVVQYNNIFYDTDTKSFVTLNAGTPANFSFAVFGIEGKNVLVKPRKIRVTSEQVSIKMTTEVDFHVVVYGAKNGTELANRTKKVPFKCDWIGRE